MGYALCFGQCGACGRDFAFNPVRVPSIRDANGVKQPICKECIEKANPIRKERGLPEITYASDAYEACAEEELGD